MRQALSLALDRQAVMNAILVAEKPADDFMPPPVTGYRQGACQYCAYNVDLAKQKLAEAGGFQGDLTLNFYADDTTLEQAMEAVATQWKDNLGINVKLNAIPHEHLLLGDRADLHQEDDRPVVGRVDRGLPEHPGLPGADLRVERRVQHLRLPEQAVRRHPGRRATSRACRTRSRRISRPTT